MVGGSFGHRRCGIKGAAVGLRQRASRGGVRNSGSQGRRIRKRKKKFVAGGKLAAACVWIPRHNRWATLDSYCRGRPAVAWGLAGLRNGGRQWKRRAATLLQP
ncbi:hypothetical protein L484_012683 [Morus notabilis]|uniref:Uncharacterized protein n=1 Tax=Morus notabilis TaxID=981085 RepID=W9QD20_9ROSA|nr:hypothetical protein L484_012683 [Morus notabilis]